jgi:hypothetical protein
MFIIPWYGVVQYGAAWLRMVRRGSVGCGIAQNDMNQGITLREAGVLTTGLRHTLLSNATSH